MTIAIIGFLFSFALILLRVPIALALGLTGYLGFAYAVGWSQSAVMLALVTKESTMSYGLVVMPLFILMGNFIAGAGISAELYRTAAAFLGHRRGGLAVATVAASSGLATLCGSSVATVVTIGKVALPSMRRFGYSDRLSTATIAAGATLGAIIPPSILLIIYGIITETHIGKLYAAAIIPGAIGAVGYVLAVRWSVWRRPEEAPASQRASREERRGSLRIVLPVLSLLTIVLGGIYSGYFTATEAAGVGAFGAFLLALIRRQLTWARLYEILLDSAQTSAVLFAMLIGATVFAEFLNYSDAHSSVLNLVLGSGLSPFSIILLICVIYIILGALMDELTMILLTIPLFFPIITGMGYDAVWFGILVIMLCEIGMICPPIGVNLFVMQSTARDVPLTTIMSGIAPFVIIDIVRVLLFASVPALVMFLPDLLF